jgi:hypothetical protein
MALVPAVLSAFIAPSLAGGAAVASAVALPVSVAVADLWQAPMAIVMALAAARSSQRFARVVMFFISRGIAPPMNGQATVPFRKK